MVSFRIRSLEFRSGRTWVFMASSTYKPVSRKDTALEFSSASFRQLLIDKLLSPGRAFTASIVDYPALVPERFNSIMF